MTRFYHSTDGKTWIAIDSASNIQGQLNSLYRDEHNTLYVATSFGLWKHATSYLWAPDTVGMSLAPGFFNNGSVTAVISDAQYLYANVGKGTAPIMRRPLDGDVWTSDVVGLSLNGRAGSFAIDKQHRLHASVGRTILHRESSGWTVDHTPPNLTQTDGTINFSFDSSGAMFASFDTSGVYYTTDGGTTWKATWLTNRQVPQAGSYSYEGSSGVSLASDANGITYAATNVYGIYLLKPVQAAGLLFDTTTLDFDTIPSGTLTHSFTVTNNGNANLVITSIESSDPHFSSHTDFLSDPIPAGDSRTVDLSFTSFSPGTYSTTFTFNSNAALGYSTLHATGTSTATEAVTIQTQGEEIHLMPNPANASVSISPNTITEITIVDLLGRVQYHAVGEKIFSRLDVHDLPNGLYRVIAADGKKSTTATLAVIH